MAIPSQDLRTKMRTCTRCHTTKDESDFHRSSYVRKRDGQRAIRFECKRCTANRVASWAEKNMSPERSAMWNRKATEKRERIKALVFAYYGGYVCACCGETERMFLSIDHINNDGADFRRRELGARNRAGNTTYRWLVKKNFPAGYQVLCMNCNHGKRMNHGVCPHQVRCNDQGITPVEPSGSKRIASIRLVANG
jgi:hypothetical protein